jgi:hypothetical protein
VSIWLLGVLHLLLAASARKAGAAIKRHQLESVRYPVIFMSDDDPLSMVIYKYNGVKRHIPKSNLRHIRLPPGDIANIDRRFPKQQGHSGYAHARSVHACALTWVAPQRVDRMSTASAFAFRFDEKCCVRDCRATKTNS